MFNCFVSFSTNQVLKNLFFRFTKKAPLKKGIALLGLGFSFLCAAPYAEAALPGLNEEQSARFVRTIRISMDYLNKTCRYPKVQEPAHYKFSSKDPFNFVSVSRASIKPDVPPAEAFSSFFVRTPKGKRVIDCTLAVTLCTLRGILEVVGPEGFNAFYRSAFARNILEIQAIPGFGEKESSPWSGGPLEPGSRIFMRQLPQDGDHYLYDRRVIKEQLQGSGLEPSLRTIMRLLQFLPDNTPYDYKHRELVLGSHNFMCISPDDCVSFNGGEHPPRTMREAAKMLVDAMNADLTDDEKAAAGLGRGSDDFFNSIKYKDPEGAAVLIARAAIVWVPDFKRIFALARVSAAASTPEAAVASTSEAAAAADPVPAPEAAAASGEAAPAPAVGEEAAAAPDLPTPEVKSSAS